MHSLFGPNLIILWVSIKKKIRLNIFIDVFEVWDLTPLMVTVLVGVGGEW